MDEIIRDERLAPGLGTPETPRMVSRRRLVLLGFSGLVALALAVPAIGANPSPSANAPGQTKDKGNKGPKTPEVAITLSGTVVQRTDGKGRPSFEMTVDGTTWELSTGPKWFHGDASPLAKYTGKSVEITGTRHQGETVVDVETVDGVAIRAAGRPPWAGGPKAVGATHPGFKAWKAAGKPGNGHGRANAPGQLKDKTKTGSDADSATD